MTLIAYGTLLLESSQIDVSISTDGIKVTGNDGSAEASADGNVSIDGDMMSHVNNADYAICIENPDNNQVIVIAGNNLEVLKSIAETASFTN